MARRKAPGGAAFSDGYAYTKCHVLRHELEAVGPDASIRLRPRFGTLITWRCNHCSTLRLDIVSRLTGELLWRTYIRPDDYGHEHLTMSQWRVILMDEMDNALLVNMEDQD